MGGYDTSTKVNNVWQAAKSDYGTPLFWLRYFSPSPGASTVVNSTISNANSECVAIWDCNSSSPCLGPITEPHQADLNGTYSDGQADAKTFCAALKYVYDNVTPLQVPTNDELYCWLGQECATSLSTGYWNGWAAYVDGYNGLSAASYPLYPCLYCSPCCSPPNCSTLKNASYSCFAIWTPEYQKCGYKLTNPPSWDAATCTGCGVSLSVPTKVWQFAEQGACGLSVAVDMDLGASGFYTPSYCFYLSSKP